MSFLKKGPEIKLSSLKPSALKEVKVPSFVQDVYFDLKDRHLLPVAVILIAAMIAVPIAIGGKGSEPEPAGGGANPEAAISNGQVKTGALVAKAAPGLRKYERRLEGRGVANPFEQKFEEEKESTGDSGGATGTEGSEGGKPSYEINPSDTPIYPGGDPTPGKLTHYSYAIDVRISGGSGNQEKSTVRRNLPGLTMLPSRETPAIVYMGSTKDGKKAIMTVSSDVQAIFGDAKCVLGSETCQMLAMEVGLPQTFVYGGAEKTYTIELLKIELVETDKLNKAPLGEPKKGKGKTQNQSMAPDSLVEIPAQ